MSFLYMMDDYPAHTGTASGTPLSMLEMHSRPACSLPRQRTVDEMGLISTGAGLGQNLPDFQRPFMMQPGMGGMPPMQPGMGPMQPMGPVMFGGAPSFSAQPAYNMQQARESPQLVNAAAGKIRGFRKLMKYIGTPDLVDAQRGGIAIWSRNTLRKRKYPFLRRVEIIDEHVYNNQPVPHYSNIYIWVHMRLTAEMLTNVHEMSKDFFYDRNKELLIVRSDSLDTAVAQAAVVFLYSRGRISYYSLVNNNLLKKYYENASKGKTRRAMYTVLNKAR